jgi:hypothetical protein
LNQVGQNAKWICTSKPSQARFVLLLAVFMSGRLPTAAQTPAQQIIPARGRVASNMTTVQTVPASSLAASFLLSEGRGESAAHFSYPFARAYEPDQNLGNLLPMREVKTLFLTQSSLPLMQFWGGRLRLDGFTSRLHMQNVQFGPCLLQDCRPRRQGYTRELPSVTLYGLRLSFHFGRDAQIERPTQIWRSFDWIVSARRLPKFVP